MAVLKDIETTAIQGVFAPLPELIRLKRYALKLRGQRPLKSSTMAGQYLSKSRGRGLEFAEVRHYQPGDDVRSIDWRITARSGKPHTRVYSEERERPIFIVCDLRSSMKFGTRVRFKSTQVANIAALLAWTYTLSGDRAGGIIYTDTRHIEIKPSRSNKTVAHLLQTLAEHCKPANHNIQSTERQSTASMLAEVRRLAKPGSKLFVLSDFHDWNEDCVKQLALINRHNDSHLVSINDPLEYELPKSGLFPISDGTHTAMLSGKQHRKGLKTHFEQRMSRLKQDAQRFNASFSRITTEQNPIHYLMNLVGER